LIGSPPARRARAEWAQLEGVLPKQRSADIPVRSGCKPAPAAQIFNRLHPPTASLLLNPIWATRPRHRPSFDTGLKGDEKSEAQTFLFHLLEAYGHDANTLPEGSTFEYRVRFAGDRTKFADFVWPGRVLIEMKSRGEKLSRHYQQTFDYWLNLVPHRPPYVVLCDFNELWIYDFNIQLHEPLDRVPVADLVNRHSALNFLYPRKSTPIFGNNWVEVTREAAKDVANVFNSLVARGESRESARRFVLQCVVAMFSEDIGLLPENMFTGLLDECRKAEDPIATSYDLIGKPPAKTASATPTPPSMPPSEPHTA
jgi:hypothetical protein